MGETVRDIDVVSLFMSGVDVIAALQQNGEISDYLELLEVFYVDGQKRRGTLEQRIQTEDFANYIIEVHGLKSAAANIGAFSLSELAKKHEHSGNDSDFDFIRENQKPLFDQYELVLSEIKRVLQKKQFGPFAVKEGGLVEQTDEELCGRVSHVLELVEDFHSKEAAKAVEELLGVQMDDKLRNAVIEVQGMLKMYEDDAAEAKLHEILKTFFGKE